MTKYNIIEYLFIRQLRIKVILRFVSYLNISEIWMN